MMGLDLAGIAVSTGSACAAGSLEPSHVLLALGRDPERAKSALRFSVGKDTTEQRLTMSSTYYQGSRASASGPTTVMSD